MVQGYTKILKEILRLNGWAYSRAGKGDHEVWTNLDRSKPIVVDNKIMSRHTTNAVLKQAGIKAKL